MKNRKIALSWGLFLSLSGALCCGPVRSETSRWGLEAKRPKKNKREASPWDYQIGEEWGKGPISQDRFDAESEVFRMAALRTARVGGATGFLLGVFFDEVLIATNSHVLPEARLCDRTAVNFELLRIQSRCARVVGIWNDIDLSLFVIQVSARERKTLLPLAQNFTFDRAPALGETLMTFGYGRANNEPRHLVVSQDEDCHVFSRPEDIRLMADPDALNPGPYQVWSFANGCDVSHGDSGSAMYGRRDGALLGIIWTGKIPKNAMVRSSQYLRDIERRQSEDVWTELSYAVPAVKIKAVLLRTLADGGLAKKDHRILEELLR